MWDLSSLTRDRTHVPCIARWIPYHWTTREVPTWMDLEVIMLSGISQTVKDKYCAISLICGIKSKTNEQTYRSRNRLIDAENKLVVAREERGGG